MDLTLSPAEFTHLKKLVHRLSGIALNPGKEALVLGRLRRRMRELGMTEIKHYLAAVEADDTGNESTLLIDALSTNVTSFYRESAHFVLFSQFLAARKAAGAKRLRVWCAAAATGEEPWTLAMLMRQAFPEPGADLALLATDISTRALATARQGVYERASVGRLPEALRRRWFITEGQTCTVHDDLRPMITFNRMNLVRPPYPMRGPFDVIFCRNVMIYFENPERVAVVGEVERLLASGGLFCLGHAESLTGLGSTLVAHSPAAYLKP
jgi:chemotaxis protein methyltransferase CheR